MLTLSFALSSEDNLDMLNYTSQEDHAVPVFKNLSTLICSLACELYPFIPCKSHNEESRSKTSR